MVLYSGTGLGKLTEVCQQVDETQIQPKGSGCPLRVKNVPPVRSPRNPHMWDQSKMHILKGENGFSVLYKLKLRQNRRLQHLRTIVQKTLTMSSELRNQEKDR